MGLTAWCGRKACGSVGGGRDEWEPGPVRLGMSGLYRRRSVPPPCVWVAIRDRERLQVNNSEGHRFEVLAIAETIREHQGSEDSVSESVGSKLGDSICEFLTSFY